MYHIQEDDYPGRCKNHRRIVDGDGWSEMTRCLDYEGKPHVCSFREPRPKVTGDWGTYTSQRYVKSKPKPWVKPGDEQCKKCNGKRLYRAEGWNCGCGRGVKHVADCGRPVPYFECDECK